ncbi:MAG: hydroxyacylglutathione hydrolase [Alphaproteobacteria bacterium]|jgi:hydroxyacylglutathione hydrolase
MLEIHRLPVRTDNYIWIAREPSSNAVAVIDPADAEPVISKCMELGLSPTHILNTHHHGDHTGGNLEVKEKFGCTVVGSVADQARIPGIDIAVGDGDVFDLGDERANVFDVTGHTLGHIMYWFGNAKALFCGDTLFAMGCGRLSEGTADQMWSALSKFSTLPDDAEIYCAHEYTQANARFALTIEPDNQDLQARAAKVDDMRAQDIPTIPSLLGDERMTNPFLRSDHPALKKAVGMIDSDALDVFTQTRLRKDNF